MKTSRLATIAAVSLGVLLSASYASAAGWGTVKGRFIYKGEAKVEPIIPNKDQAYCNQHKLVTEDMKVGPKGELQDVFVYLYVPTGKKVDINPDYEKQKTEPKVLDNKGCRFEPHAMTLWTHHPLEVHNSDPGIGHNTNASSLLNNPSFNQTIPNDQPLVKKMTKSEPLPAKITCNVHPWMNAYVLVRDNPYMAVSDKDGKFEIKNVPAGKQPFAFWHESKAYIRDLKVGSAKADRKGQVTLDIKPGATLDLGDITVTPALLGK
jgi:hypothetical protein